MKWNILNSTNENTQSLLSSFDCRINSSQSLHFCFTVSFQSNDLTYLVNYSKRQEMIYKIISYLHNEERMSYRQITKKLNSFNIKTTRNKVFGKSGNSVYSVLKRFKEREERIKTVRQKNFKMKMSNFCIKYL